METANIITIPEEGITNLEISGSFYQRLNKLLVDYGSVNGEDELLKTIFKIKNGKIVNENSEIIDHQAFNVETIMILIRDIESNFKRDGLVKDNEVAYEISPEMKKTINDLQ